MKKLLKTLSVIMCAILLTTSVVPNLPVNSVETVYAATKKPKLNYTKKTIYEGKTFTLKVSGTKSKVKWSTSNKKIATVNSKGVVKGVKKGNATITAKIDKKSLKCKVTVKKKESIKPSTSSAPSKPSEKPSIEPSLPNETPSIIKPLDSVSEPSKEESSVPSEDKTNELEENTNDIIEKLDFAEERCEMIMDSIYGAWYFYIYEASDYYNESILLPYATEAKIPKDKVQDIIARKYNETSGYGIAAYIRVLSTNLEIVHTYYDEFGTFDIIEQNLEYAKTMIGQLPDDFKKKELLKDYYNAVNKYYNFVESPSGSFSQLGDKRQSLEEAVNDAKQELEW